MLAAQARVLGRDAGAVGAVAAGAGRHLALADAAAVDLLAQRDQVLVLGEAGLDLLGADEPGDVASCPRRTAAAASGLMIGLLRLPDLKSCSCLRMYSGCCCASLGLAGVAGVAVGVVAGGAARPWPAYVETRRPWPGRAWPAWRGCGGSRRGGGLVGREAGAGARRPGGQPAAGEQATSYRGSWIRLAQNPAILQWRTRADSSPHDHPDRPAGRRLPPPAGRQPPSAAASRCGWLHTARFLTSAPQLEHLPALELPEIAFVGRSNAGKSTASTR